MCYRKYKCSDFYCISIPYYPKEKKGEVIDQAYYLKQKEMTKTLIEVKNKILIKIFGKDNDWFYQNYQCYTQETIEEFLDIFHNIKAGTHHDYRYYIPVEYPELIEYIKSIVPPYAKHIKKFSLINLSYKEYHKHERGKLYHFSILARNFTLESKAKSPHIYTKEIEELRIEDKIILK